MPAKTLSNVAVGIVILLLMVDILLRLEGPTNAQGRGDETVVGFAVCPPLEGEYDRRAYQLTASGQLYEMRIFNNASGSSTHGRWKLVERHGTGP